MSMRKKIEKALATSMALVITLCSLASPGAKAANGPNNSTYTFVSVVGYDDPENPVTIPIFKGSRTTQGTTYNSAVEGITYDRETNTLTLNNYQANAIVVPNMMGDDFKICVEGENVIRGLVAYGDAYGGSITLTGNGSLKIAASEWGEDVAIRLLAENSNACLTVESGVSLDLSANRRVIFINDSGIVNDPATAVNFKNGQEVKVTCMENTYEAAVTRPGLLLDPYGNGPDQYPLCTYQGQTHWYASSYGGYYVSANTVVYDEELDLYYLDPASSNAAFNLSMTSEEFDEQCTILTTDKVPIYYGEKNSYGFPLAKDGNDNQYAVYSTWINGESRKTAYDVKKEVTLADGKAYHIMTRNETIDADSLEELTETFYTGRYNYSVDEKTLQITGRAEAVVEMYRLYNPNSGEHFYTGDETERDHLVSVGWQYEGIAWNAPVSSNTPVYRLFNPNDGGDHHYTPSEIEKGMLIEAGWQYEGICWYSDDDQTTPLYRLYNPNAKTGCHHYTASERERDDLVNLGWNFEGIGWFGR